MGEVRKIRRPRMSGTSRPSARSRSAARRRSRSTSIYYLIYSTCCELDIDLRVRRRAVTVSPAAHRPGHVDFPNTFVTRPGVAVGRSDQAHAQVAGAHYSTSARPEVLPVDHRYANPGVDKIIYRYFPMGLRSSGSWAICNSRVQRRRLAEVPARQRPRVLKIG